MTTTDMILRVRQGTREIDSYVKGSLLKEEILLQLNIAQNQYQYNVYKQGERDLKSLVDIRSTQKLDTISATTPKTTAIVNSKEFEFPADFNFYHLAYGISTSPVYKKKIEITSKDIPDSFIETPENVPIIRSLIGFTDNNRLVVVHDPFDTLTSISLTYYRTLLTITDIQDCELPVHTHDKVCEIAILNIVGRRNPENYQISADLNERKQ